MSYGSGRAWSNMALEAFKVKKNKTRISFPSDWSSKAGPTFTWYSKLSCTKFRSLHYRKERERPFCHEFICVELTNGALCRIERFGDPNARTDALTAEGSLAHDYAEILTAYDCASLDKTSDLIITLAFVDPQDLLNVLKICYHIQQDRQTRAYTLQRYNCYFFSWCVMMTLVQGLHPKSWEHRGPPADSEWKFRDHYRHPWRGGVLEVDALLPVGWVIAKEIQKRFAMVIVLVILGIGLGLDVALKVGMAAAAVAVVAVARMAIPLTGIEWLPGHPPKTKLELVSGMFIGVFLGLCMGMRLMTAMAMSSLLVFLAFLWPGLWMLWSFLICSSRESYMQALESSMPPSDDYFTQTYIVPHGFRVEEIGMGEARRVVMDIQDAIQRICKAMGR